MANEMTSSALSTDQEKFLAAKLIQRSYLKLVMGSLCDKVQMPEGAGLTGYFVRYKRMNVPLTALSDDGADPANSTFTIDSVTVTLDEWGDVLTITNVAQLTTKHPVIQQAVQLLADNAARVMDREITLVLLAGTNVQYGDGSVTTRTTVTQSMKVSESVMHKARITLTDAGAPPRGGPAGDARQENAKGQMFSQAYVAVCGPQVLGDIMSANTSLGTWAAAATYANAKALYGAEVGTWLNIRWVETNFIPKFTLLGNKTVAVASAADAGITGMVITAVDGGGTLTSGATYYYKITRKDLTRGFEEAISIEHTTAAAATANNESFTFALPSTSGYVYNIYFGSSTGDANLKLQSTGNHAASATVTVTAVSSSTTTAPAHIRAANDASDPTTIHPVFVFAEAAVNWVGFYGIRTYISQDISVPSNVLRRRRSVGYSFFGKAMRRDETRLLRLEVAASY
jgi:N4-gp56 family major capsid protein